MAYAATTKPSLYNNTKLYTGTGSSNAQTGIGFQPDWLWIKRRDATANHRMVNAPGGSSYLHSSSTNAVGADSSYISSFDSDGFTVGTATDTNANSGTYVGWCWKANGGTTVSNGDGTITSTVQANTGAGFSIVTYTGDGANGTVGHGLGVAPEIVIVKRLNSTGNWSVNGSVAGLTYGTNKLMVNSTNAISADTNEVTSANSTTFTAGTSGSVGTAGGDYVAYCFKSITGYSKIASYSGTGSSNSITGLGFQPQYVMIKSTTSSEDWAIFDASRGANLFLTANTTSADQSFSGFSFETDGFTVPGTSGMTNGSGQTYFYMAFK